MTSQNKTEKPIKWGVEQRGRIGKLSDQPLHFIADHPCGAELHVFLAFIREPAWGFDPGPEVPDGWYFEVKGKYSAFNTPFMYEGGKTAEEAKAAALEYITERTQEVAAEIAAAWSK